LIIARTRFGRNRPAPGSRVAPGRSTFTRFIFANFRLARFQVGQRQEALIAMIRLLQANESPFSSCSTHEHSTENEERMIALPRTWRRQKKLQYDLFGTKNHFFRLSAHLKHNAGTFLAYDNVVQGLWESFTRPTTYEMNGRAPPLTKGVTTRPPAVSL
jgi:hypothetical protein